MPYSKKLYLLQFLHKQDLVDYLAITNIAYQEIDTRLFTLTLYLDQRDLELATNLYKAEAALIKEQKDVIDIA